MLDGVDTRLRSRCQLCGKIKRRAFVDSPSKWCDKCEGRICAAIGLGAVAVMAISIYVAVCYIYSVFN